jgi:hypothetical protein
VGVGPGEENEGVYHKAIAPGAIIENLGLYCELFQLILACSRSLSVWIKETRKDARMQTLSK